MRVRRGLSRLLVPLALAATLPATGSAGAAPPEGCIGFPSIPEAIVCIDQFSPENAVPHVAPGPGQTFVVPEFCVFECVGPTPLTVPNVVVTPGSGVVVTVTYNGRTESVVVPSGADAGAVVAQVERTVADTLAAVLRTAGDTAASVLRTTEDQPAGALALNARMNIDCYGCGVTHGTLTGTAVGVLDGVLVSVPVYGDYTMVTPQGVTCVMSATASGSLTIGGHELSFNWAMFSSTVLVTTSGALNGLGVGQFTITSPSGIPCGGPVDAQFTAPLTGTA
jgi:hypothetical protein